MPALPVVKAVLPIIFSFQSDKDFSNLSRTCKELYLNGNIYEIKKTEKALNNLSEAEFNRLLSESEKGLFDIKQAFVLLNQPSLAGRLDKFLKDFFTFKSNSCIRAAVPLSQSSGFFECCFNDKKYGLADSLFRRLHQLSSSKEISDLAFLSIYEGIQQLSKGRKESRIGAAPVHKKRKIR